MRDSLLVTTNVFIVAYLLLAWGWNYPADVPLQKLVSKARGLVVYSGLWHSWNMFAPEPMYVNRRLSAVLYLASGETRTWEALDLGRMAWWRAFFEVRDRKYQDNLLSGEMAYLKPALCDWLARVSREVRVESGEPEKSGETRGESGAGDPHPSPLPDGEGMKSPHVGSLVVGEGIKIPDLGADAGADGMKVVKIELVMWRRLVPPLEKRGEPPSPFDRHVIYAYDVVKQVAIPLKKSVESGKASAGSPHPSPLPKGEGMNR